MQSTIKRLQKRSSVFDICGLRGSSSALFIARTAAELNRPICCILPSDEQLEVMAQDISLFTTTEVLVYPSFEIPPYTPLSPDPATVCQRLATLHRIQTSSSPVIVLTSAEAALRKILPRKILDQHCELVIRDEETDQEDLIQSLIHSGYQRCSMVQHEGDLAVRGGIVDIFAPSSHQDIQGPLRLDFFGDTVDSIRVFDPISQRSINEIDEAIILPASDILFPPLSRQEAWRAYLRGQAEENAWSEEGADFLLTQLTDQIRFTGIEFSLPLVYEAFNSVQTIFDYFSEDTVMFVDDSAAINSQVELLWDRIEANHDEACAHDVAALPPERLFISPGQLTSALTRFSLVNFCVLPDPDSPYEQVSFNQGDHTLLNQEIELHRKKRGNLAPLAERLLSWSKKGDTIILACRSSRQAFQLKEILNGYHITTSSIPAPIDLHAIKNDGSVLLVEHHLARGFDLFDEQTHVLSAAELFGEKRLRPKSNRKGRPSEAVPLQVEELKQDDIVVHRDHGLGRFLGLMNMEFAGQKGDFMQMEYRSGDKLYVPIDRLHLVSRYQGLTDQQPKLDQLGSTKWLNTKNKVTEAVWKVAQDLLDIYARRSLQTGQNFSRPGELFQELEQSFPYDETSGQLKAIEDVIDDLTRDQPMDRLICGDVGYGKTEVAARAAFKVVEDGHQVAVLVPTTVLAEQHAATFRERLATFPVEIACINRFRTAAQQKEIIRDLASGKIDLLVGTHRLLSKDVVFNKLGLLIVDEEHRFGVTHKEKIKKLKAGVDVLTLTATPIPRTLQMSLLGIRDLSVISTPPRRRRSVKTFLARHDDLVIREAILREQQRGGQVFLVHNRVRTIGSLAQKIEKLVPQARIAVAHGQMPGRVLEDIMVKFINHEIDVLVCTTIIESGLDIPNANTIIINRADQLGLADMYQLRGRVGRSSRQSYAYLLVPSLDSLTKDAKQRLQALMDCNELGGGFKLAMNDLQIRGGGNLLGVSQSGHIAAVGYDLYLELLQSTVADMKQQAEGASLSPVADIDPEIKLRVTAFIPDSYIADPAQRYHAYRRISLAGSAPPEQLEDLHTELIDRYGSPPPEVTDLFSIVGLKYRLIKLGIIKVEQGPDSLIFSFIQNAPVDPQVILDLISRRPKKKTQPIRLTPDNRLVVPLSGQKDAIAAVELIIRELDTNT